MTSILVLRGGALGDFLLTLPLLRALRRRWPSARLELVGNATAAALAVEAGLLQAAHSQHEARWVGLYQSALPPALGDWLSSFDLVLSAWPDPESRFSRIFPLRAGQTFVPIAPIVEGAGPAWRQLLVAAQAAFGGDFGMGDEIPRLPVPPSAREEGRKRLGFDLSPGGTGPIALHPGSGSRRKNAPWPEWSQLLHQLAPRPTLVVLGEAEAALPAGVEDRKSASVRLAREWPLSVLAGALSYCSGYIGHDTGVSHLAASIGVPSLLVFGPTDPAVWSPPGGNVTCLRPHSDRVTLPVDEILRRLQSAVTVGTVH
ncbi:MAG TPA: glycosyltransferase family 9 protein [Opitutaceae bacterium]|nr:glycosyltransferase family 9 protein [Opitutaceae bacterium]